MNLSLILPYLEPVFYAFVGTLALGVLALRFFPRWGLNDRPEKYGLSRKPIPYYGGIVIFLAFAGAVLFFVPLNQHLVGLLIGVTLIFGVGFWDDWKGLSPWLRLFCQMVAALILVISGIGILSIQLPFIGQLAFDQWQVGGIYLLSAIFTVIWIMTIVNAMNFLDGISGLNSGTTVIAALTIFVLSINPLLHADIKSQTSVALLSAILAAVALAFVFLDFPKPRILMGDSGSTVLGFLLATLAIFSGGKVATAFLVLGIPILDMAWVVLRRTFIEKRPFWHGDLKHMHHRLKDIGFSDRQVVLFYYIITAIFGFNAALLVSSQQKFFMLIALLIIMLLLAAFLIFLPNRKP